MPYLMESFLSINEKEFLGGKKYILPFYLSEMK